MPGGTIQFRKRDSLFALICLIYRVSTGGFYFHRDFFPRLVVDSHSSVFHVALYYFCADISIDIFAQ